jgi:hypothetical protein
VAVVALVAQDNIMMREEKIKEEMVDQVHHLQFLARQQLMLVEAAVEHIIHQALLLMLVSVVLVAEEMVQVGQELVAQELQIQVVVVVEVLLTELVVALVVLVLLLFVGRNCADKYSINLRVLNV